MKTLTDAGTQIGPTFIGVAAGFLLGEAVHRAARKPLMFLLLGVGTAAIVPGVAEGVRNAFLGRHTQKGAQRTLRSIRDAGLSARPDDLVMEEELFVG